jgi:hypothetical protein
MLNHTSGLRDYLGLMLLAGADIDDVTSTAEALRLMARQKGLDFEPGAEHQYSNTGYFLASVIIQRASGRTLREFAAENIFKPLGMASTTYIDDHTAVLANRAIGYAPGEDGFHRDVSNWEQNGDGGVFTNVEDLLKWDENFYHPRVGGAGLPAELLRPGILNNGDTLDYALGLMHESLRGIPIVTHGGSWGGYRAELLRVPSEHFSVAVLGNVVTTNPSQLARMVAVTVLGDRLPPKAARAASPKRVAVAIAPETFDAYAGDYELDEEAGFVLSFRRDGSRFYVGATDQSELEIFPSSDSTYFPTSIDASFTFHHNASGELMVTLHQGGDHDAHRWVPYTLAPAKLPEYAGTYYSPELDIAVTIGSADSRVVATHGGLDSAALKPVGNDHFVGDLPYVNDVMFERNKDGRVMAMLITLARSKNLRFERKEGR